MTAARLFFAFPQEPPRSFRRPRGKAVYSLLNGPGWNSQGGGGRSRFIQAPAMQFMRTLPKYLGTLTFSLNFRNIKGRKGGGLCKVVCSFRRCDNKYACGGGEVPVRLFQIRTAYEAKWGRQAFAKEDDRGGGHCMGPSLYHPPSTRF